MARLGAVQVNTVWSWCAVNESRRRVYFSIWTDKACDYQGRRAYVMQEPDWGMDDVSGRKSPARNDQDAKFSLVFDGGYEPYGYFIVAKDPSEHPRQIAETRTTFVMKLELHTAESGEILGIPIERVDVR